MKTGGSSQSPDGTEHMKKKPWPAPAGSCSAFPHPVLLLHPSTQAAGGGSSGLHKPTLQGGQPQVSEGEKEMCVNMELGRATFDLS